MIDGLDKSEFTIRRLRIEDYEVIYELWINTPGMGLRSLDDTYEGIAFFLKRNPDTNFVAIDKGEIIGTVLCGHDGRRGYLYHVCVRESARRRSVGKRLVEHVNEALRAEGIHKLALVTHNHNETGNCFWKGLGWEYRTDLNYYTLSLNENNI